jgi:mannose-6-phosphate isomerase-like protein (cupin superfamily)
VVQFSDFKRTNERNQLVIRTAKKRFVLVVPALALALVAALAASGGGLAQTGSSASAQAAPQAGKADANGVILFDKDVVDQSFSKGATLYNGNSEGHNYRVHTLRRDAPGEVEIHAKDTDIFYILDGSATFVTGGVMTGGRDSAPDEKRGKSMEGGTIYHLSKGNVVIIPANVTHWFKEIQQPVTYLTIKVR